MNQNWDFWSENKPSGNPGYQAAVIKLQKPGKANSGQGRQWQPKSETKKHLFSRKRARQTLKIKFQTRKKTAKISTLLGLFKTVHRFVRKMAVGKFGKSCRPVLRKQSWAV
jgi:hypothetical protein